MSDVTQILGAKFKSIVNIASSDGQPCLHAAIINGHDGVVKSLLARGANANVVDVDGVSALQAAAFHGSLVAVEELAVHGAVLDEQVIMLGSFKKSCSIPTLHGSWTVCVIRMLYVS